MDVWRVTRLANPQKLYSKIVYSTMETIIQRTSLREDATRESDQFCYNYLHVKYFIWILKGLFAYWIVVTSFHLRLNTSI